MILFPGSATDTDCPYHLTVFLQRNPTSKNHDLTIIGSMDAKELLPRLGMFCQVFGGNIKSPRGIGLFNRNIYATDPGAIHTDMGHEIATSICYGDVHRLPDLFCFLFCCPDDLFCLLQFNAHNLGVLLVDNFKIKDKFLKVRTVSKLNLWALPKDTLGVRALLSKPKQERKNKNHYNCPQEIDGQIRSNGFL